MLLGGYTAREFSVASGLLPCAEAPICKQHAGPDKHLRAFICRLCWRAVQLQHAGKYLA